VCVCILKLGFGEGNGKKGYIMRARVHKVVVVVVVVVVVIVVVVVVVVGKKEEKKGTKNHTMEIQQNIKEVLNLHSYRI